MTYKFDISNLILLAFCVYIKCVFTLDHSDNVAGKALTEEETIKTSTFRIGGEPTDDLKVNKKSDKVVNIPLDKPIKNLDHRGHQPKVNLFEKGSPRLVLEGGDSINLTSTAKTNISQLESETNDDGTNHSKGSKPRKGVQHPGSVVPRKGVEPLGAFDLNQPSSSATTGPSGESTGVISEKKMPQNNTELEKVDPDQRQIQEQSTQKVSHPRKPDVVTDSDDADDFEKYPIIRTSTTGEDYIIIGIVIVLGIWCSIFGALIFYRRAGEYWDRRHYRRMDFLVEGMYND